MITINQRINFYKRFKECLKKSNYNLSDIALMCRVSTSTVSNWYREKSYPRIKSMGLLTKVFNVSFDWLRGKVE